MRGSLRTAMLAVGVLVSALSVADEWDFTGFVGAESQTYWQDSKYPGQSNGSYFSLLVQPEFYWSNEEGDQRISIVGFGRADSNDSERSHVDLREAYWGINGDRWDLNIGVSKVFWGVTESRHLVDVINQTDLVEDIDGEDKLGQPIINFNLLRGFGELGFYILPYFRERTFSSSDGRLRTPIPVDGDGAVYESSQGTSHTDFAFRYSHYFGDVDIGAYIFTGTSRDPRFMLSPMGDFLIPVYEQMTQVGVDLQYTRNAWLWKLEAITRNAQSDNSFGVVGGFEYTFFGVRDSAADVGVLLELLYDDRNAVAPPTSFDNDVFMGTRLALNDASDTSVLAGVVVDVDTKETFLNIEAERRIGDRLSLEARFRVFTNADQGDALFSFESDDYFQVRMSWYY